MNFPLKMIGFVESRGGKRGSVELKPELCIFRRRLAWYVLRLSNNLSVAVQQLVLVAFCSQAQLTLFFASGHFTFPV